MKRSFVPNDQKHHVRRVTFPSRMQRDRSRLSTTAALHQGNRSTNRAQSGQKRKKPPSHSPPTKEDEVIVVRLNEGDLENKDRGSPLSSHHADNVIGNDEDDIDEPGNPDEEAIEVPSRNDEQLDERTKRRKPSRTRQTRMTPGRLTAPDGLIRIKNEFPKLMQSRYNQILALQERQAYGKEARQRGENAQRHEKLLASASYSRALLSQYRKVFEDLSSKPLFVTSGDEIVSSTSGSRPLSFMDALFEVERIGSNRTVRRYVDAMRDDVRREYLGKMWGKEKTDRLLRELEQGLEPGTSLAAIASHQALDNPPHFSSSDENGGKVKEYGKNDAGTNKGYVDDDSEAEFDDTPQQNLDNEAASPEGSEGANVITSKVQTGQDNDENFHNPIERFPNDEELVKDLTTQDENETKANDNPKPAAS